MSERSTTERRKWERKRAEDKRRSTRIKLLKADIARVHATIWRMNPRDDHKAIARLRGQLRTLEVRLRYIAGNHI